MTKVVYKVVAHDGGWAYTLDGAFSEPYVSRDGALAAAKQAAAEQHLSGETTQIEFQDEAGKWHTEESDGSDRPDAEVEG